MLYVYALIEELDTGNERLIALFVTLRSAKQFLPITWKQSYPGGLMLYEGEQEQYGRKFIITRERLYP